MKALYVSKTLNEMAVNELDKYYASSWLIEKLIKETLKVVPKNKITEIIEPAAGDGAFIPYLDKIANELGIEVKYYDLHPEHPRIEPQNFLTTPLTYKKGRLIITGPPYGYGGKLWLNFAKKASEISDYVAFISPVSHYNEDYPVNNLKLLKSIHLGKIEFYGSKIRSGKNIKVKTCLNIYKRIPFAKEIDIYEKIDNDFFIKEIKKSKHSFKNPERADYYICNLGAAVGVITPYIKYESNLGITLKNKSLKEPFEEFMKNFHKKYYKKIEKLSTSTPFLSIKMFKNFLLESPLYNKKYKYWQVQ